MFTNVVLLSRQVTQCEKTVVLGLHIGSAVTLGKPYDLVEPWFPHL